jgi:NADPH:quinone reductase-like Zn-dependent oxidoreductase
MRAAVQDRYGAVDEVLHLREIAVPDVAAGEVLVRRGAQSGQLSQTTTLAAAKTASTKTSGSS